MDNDKLTAAVRVGMRVAIRRNKCILSFIKAFEVENPHLFQRLRSNFQLSGPIFFSDNGYSDQI